MSKKIGILTSGGDCAGLNAIIYSVVKNACDNYNWNVLGIKNGTAGLLCNPYDYINLTSEHLNSNLVRQGGTILGTTNKNNPFFFPTEDGKLLNRTKEIIEAYHQLKLDALIGVGGDGSLKILRDIAEQGKLNLVAIPKTIDNDIGQTEISIGYETAVSIATQALDQLQPTAASHSRVMILEVMGRDAGHIALAAGIAGAADVILIPEIPYQFNKIASHIQNIKQKGRNFALIIVAEAVKTELGEPLMTMHSGGSPTYGGIGYYISENISKLTDAETRVTILGHVQRGAEANAKDRIVASAFGVHAVNLIAQEKFDRLVIWKNRKVTDIPIYEGIQYYQTINLEDTLVKTARGLGICFGD
ncbi:MAG: ATP-dependent 6-phosphofructokinase [Alphaproteobacteria bacterium]|nr:ATP-dependent 6-phosphofructokinase [Alphaproteobacteria bacterium]